MEKNDLQLEQKMMKAGAEIAGWKKLMLVSIGVFLTAFGLEMFLTPNRIIIGGIKGISSLLSHVTEMQMGLFLFFLNLPFVLYNSKKMRKNKALLTIFWLILLSLLTILLHPFPPLIENPPLAAFFGGLFLGCGVGLIFRFGGLADGVQHAALFIKKRVALSIAEIIMVINVILLCLAGFLFGWDQAVYSIFAYLVAFKSTQFTLMIFRERAVWIKSARSDVIERTIEKQLGTDYHPLSPANATAPDEIYLFAARKNERMIKKIVKEIDPDASYISTPIDSGKSLIDFW